MLRRLLLPLALVGVALAATSAAGNAATRSAGLTGGVGPG
jgi:hypothetical protein